MNKDYLAMMDEGELEAYAKVLGFTTAAAQTAAASSTAKKERRCFMQIPPFLGCS